jgi:hypothetical protein
MNKFKEKMGNVQKMGREEPKPSLKDHEPYFLFIVMSFLEASRD